MRAVANGVAATAAGATAGSVVVASPPLADRTVTLWGWSANAS